jgi:prepilin-type N-terminal cleavage/methylation domain-containing protein
VSNRTECYSEEGYKDGSAASCAGSPTLGFSGRAGFTLVELVVAMAILLVVVIGILGSVSFAYNSANGTELRNTAKNVASYTLEYLRSRTVTRGSATLYGLLNPSGAPATGTYRWYDATTNSNGALPSMIDACNLPVQSNRFPCNYTPTAIRSTTTPKKDGDQNPSGTTGIGAGSAVIRFSSKHPALPSETYADCPLAFTSTLQGYVSVRNTSAPSATENPSPEDGNLARMLFSGSNVVSGAYRTRLTDLTSTGAWTGLVVRYPGVYPSTQPVITSFSPLTGYVAKVYTSDATSTGRVKTTTPNPEYDPYYTNVAGEKAGTQAYRGFRVLTQIVARTTDRTAYNHVQYYDVTVTVLWMNGTKESNYELVSRILVY